MLQFTEANVLRVLFLFEILNGGGGWWILSDVDKWTTASRSTTHRYLKKLVAEGLVYQNKKTY